jgi:hypothetical protein
MQMRISIPFIGGVTMVYEEAEVQKMKDRMRSRIQSVKSALTVNAAKGLARTSVVLSKASAVTAHKAVTMAGIPQSSEEIK